jgi:hypothetical protein
MGRALFFASAIASAFLLLSCQKSPPPAAPTAAIADSKSCFSIVPDLSLWGFSGTALTQKGTVQIGEKLALLGQTRKATLNGKERDFLSVRRDTGTEGWVRADSVVSNAILAVTTSEVVIYSVPRNTAATTATIARMTVLAIHSDSGGMPFIHVSVFNAQQKPSVSEVWLRNEGVSARPDDVQAAILLQLAAASKSSKQQEAFLSSGIKDYPQSLFLPQLQQAFEALHAPPQAPQGPPAQAQGQQPAEATSPSAGGQPAAAGATNPAASAAGAQPAPAQAAPPSQAPGSAPTNQTQAAGPGGQPAAATGGVSTTQ